MAQDEHDDVVPTLTEEPRALSRVEERHVERAVQILDGSDPKDILYQHTVLCQAFLPYRDPKHVREWSRSNGRVSLFVQAGSVMNPATKEWTPVGLPFGPKARLVLSHLNTRALRAGSNIVPLEEGSFTGFVKSMMDPLRDQAVAPNGRELRAFREQLTRWSVANMTLATSIDNTRAIHDRPQIIDHFEITFQRADGQRYFWPDTITLTEQYWTSLQKHAVPLDARALSALSHSGLALDIYQWLAQRLHRINPGQDVILPRHLLHKQFGFGYAVERKFWSVFTEALRQVVRQYRAAHVFVDDEGLHLLRSPPPVPPRLHVVPKALSSQGR